MNKYHFILPLLSFILFLGTYIAALDEASRPKSTVATVFRPGFSRIGLIPLPPAQSAMPESFFLDYAL